MLNLEILLDVVADLLIALAGGVLFSTRSCFQLILEPYLTAWCVSLQSFSSDNLQHNLVFRSLIFAPGGGKMTDAGNEVASSIANSPKSIDTEI